MSTRTFSVAQFLLSERSLFAFIVLVSLAIACTAPSFLKPNQLRKHSPDSSEQDPVLYFKVTYKRGELASDEVDETLQYLLCDEDSSLSSVKPVENPFITITDSFLGLKSCYSPHRIEDFSDHCSQAPTKTLNSKHVKALWDQREFNPNVGWNLELVSSGISVLPIIQIGGRYGLGRQIPLMWESSPSQSCLISVVGLTINMETWEVPPMREYGRTTYFSPMEAFAIGMSPPNFHPDSLCKMPVWMPQPVNRTHMNASETAPFGEMPPLQDHLINKKLNELLKYNRHRLPCVLLPSVNATKAAENSTIIKPLELPNVWVYSINYHTWSMGRYRPAGNADESNVQAVFIFSSVNAFLKCLFLAMLFMKLSMRLKTQFKPSDFVVEKAAGESNDNQATSPVSVACIAILSLGIRVASTVSMTLVSSLVDMDVFVLGKNYLGPLVIVYFLWSSVVVGTLLAIVPFTQCVRRNWAWSTIDFIVMLVLISIGERFSLNEMILSSLSAVGIVLVTQLCVFFGVSQLRSKIVESSRMELVEVSLSTFGLPMRVLFIFATVAITYNVLMMRFLTYMIIGASSYTRHTGATLVSLPALDILLSAILIGAGTGMVVFFKHRFSGGISWKERFRRVMEPPTLAPIRMIAANEMPSVPAFTVVWAFVFGTLAAAVYIALMLPTLGTHFHIGSYLFVSLAVIFSAFPIPFYFLGASRSICYISAYRSLHYHNAGP